MNVARTALVGAVTLSISLSACEQPEPPAEPRLRPVKYIEVSRDTGARVRTFAGVSRSSQEARLSFKVGGTVEALDVAVGDTVRPGQSIARLDPSTFELQAQQAQADLARAQAEERNTTAAYQRVRGLYENNNASRTELDSARAAAESARAQVRAARKALDLASLNVSYTELVASDHCSVASTRVEVGENVTAGQEIALVTCGDRIEVEVSVPESLIALFESRLPAAVRFDSVPDRSYTGVVTEVAVAATGGATFPVIISLTEQDSALRSGLAAQVSFVFGGASDQALTVPSVAVGEDTEGRFVFLLTDGDGEPGQGLIKRQPVRVGELTSGGIEILDGLQPGNKVVTAGVSMIRDGMRVKAN